MARHTESLETLATVRRRLLARLADTVVRNKATLLRNSRDGGEHDPFAGVADFAEIADGLVRLNAAIDGLQDTAGANEHGSRNGSERVRGSDVRRDGTFDDFVELVERDRMQEAAQELGRILKMPLDRVITASRFFARAARAHPEIAHDLPQLCRQIKESPPEQCVRLLVTTFGFQAVESQAAIRQLRELAREAHLAPTHTAHQSHR